MDDWMRLLDNTNEKGNDMTRNKAAKSLDKFGAKGYSVDEQGVVYGKMGSPLNYQYVGHGYKGVVVVLEGVAKPVRVDRLVLAAFHDIPLKEKVDIRYNDFDRSNVKLENLTFQKV